MALFNVINEIEGANVRQETKFVTFWYIRLAFDSVPRHLQLLAWRRLGVPADVADWFIELDTNVSTFISTPLYNTKRQMSTLEEIQQGVQHMIPLNDLSTITGGSNGAYMQTLQAKWLPAFCAFTGLELHPKKIKPTIVGPVHKHHLKYLKAYNY
jgi:hypothetical protein